MLFYCFYYFNCSYVPYPYSLWVHVSSKLFTLHSANSHEMALNAPRVNKFLECGLGFLFEKRQVQLSSVTDSCNRWIRASSAGMRMFLWSVKKKLSWKVKLWITIYAPTLTEIWIQTEKNRVCIPK
ncbi:hypothetical protein AMECASPLE_028859 [Ameca splendens]|uniref:Uncharacterized protein n=1 Tax=Ameca splendens TaxID=208324 RepID=A0ABV0ZER6_9TELE